MGKFEEDFSEPMYFSNDTSVISGFISKEDAVKYFSEYLGENITLDDITSDRVRFRIGDIDGEVVNGWFSNAGSGKGTKPVWVYGE